MRRYRTLYSSRRSAQVNKSCLISPEIYAPVLSPRFSLAAQHSYPRPPQRRRCPRQTTAPSKRRSHSARAKQKPRKSGFPPAGHSSETALLRRSGTMPRNASAARAPVLPAGEFAVGPTWSCIPRRALRGVKHFEADVRSSSSANSIRIPDFGNKARVAFRT